MFLIVLITTVILIYLVKILKEKLYFLKHVHRIPGPKGWPIIGNALELKHTNEMLYQFHDYTKKYGDIVKVQIGPAFLTFVSDPLFLEKIMSSTKILKKTPDYDFFSDWLGTGLLLSTGIKWQKRRKALTPSFHFNILEQFVETFDKKGNILMEKLGEQVGKDAVDIHPLINLYTLDVICDTAMGISINAQTEGNTSEYVKAVDEMSRIFIVRTMSVIKRIDFLYQFTEDYRSEKRSIEILHNMTDSVIKKRRSLINNGNNPNNNAKSDEFGIKKRIAFLDLLLQCTIDGKKLSDTDVREEVDTFMFAGHDTTSITISFALFCLSQNTEVQKKAYEEVYSIFGDDKSRPATSKELQEMKYLELIIKETLRLYPSVPAYGRQLTADFEWDGKIYPAGLTVLFFTYALHRDPKLYTDPEKFIPERFLNEVKNVKNGFTYIPFSAGPRNCMGQKFAMLQLKSTLSKILRNFELLPVDGFVMRLLFETVLKSENGMQVRLKRR